MRKRTERRKTIRTRYHKSKSLLKTKERRIQAHSQMVKVSWGDMSFIFLHQELFITMSNKDHRSNCDKEDMPCLITRSAWCYTRTKIQSTHSYFKLIREENGAKMFCGSDWRWPSINNQFISRTWDTIRKRITLGEICFTYWTGRHPVNNCKREESRYAQKEAQSQVFLGFSGLFLFF